MRLRRIRDGSDISKPDGVWRDPDTARRIMRSYARLQGSQSANTVIAADIAAHEPDTFKTRTPSFRMVLVADGDFDYRRKDGVVVCSIGCLRP